MGDVYGHFELIVQTGGYPGRWPTLYWVSAAIVMYMHVLDDSEENETPWPNGAGFTNVGSHRCDKPVVLSFNIPGNCPDYCKDFLCDPCGATITISFE